MGKIKMSVKLLNVINAVVDYRRYIISNNYIFPQKDFDDIEKTKRYFKTLPLPEGVNHNNANFEKILIFGGAASNILDKWNNMECCDLCKEDF